MCPLFRRSTGCRRLYHIYNINVGETSQRVICASFFGTLLQGVPCAMHSIFVSSNFDGTSRVSTGVFWLMLIVCLAIPLLQALSVGILMRNKPVGLITSIVGTYTGLPVGLLAAISFFGNPRENLWLTEELRTVLLLASYLGVSILVGYAANLVSVLTPTQKS